MEDTQHIKRVDARDKVTGAPIYASDRNLPNMLHAALAVSTIVKGRILELDVSAAETLQGVELVLTHRTISAGGEPGFLMGGGYGFQSFQPMVSDTIAYRGQPIAMVVAQTYEIAAHAASLIGARYEAVPFSSSIDSSGVEAISQANTPLQRMFPDTVAGDAVAAFTTAVTTVDASFHSQAQHANPIELIATVAEWNGDQLTIYEGTQNSSAIKFGVAAQLGISPDQVTVISPTVGGGFGQKNSLQAQTALAARAAQVTGRPVKLVVPRSQLFLGASFRAESRHRLRLGADANGQLTSALYDVDAQTSRHDFFPADYTGPASRLYDIPNFIGHQRLIRTDTQTPGYMRAPFEHLSSFAMESAIDEMAERLGRDPVEYRLSHDTQTDVVTGLPLSSRHLAQCLREGAERFGWARRDPRPGSMRDEEGNAVGWGVAVGCYKAATAVAIARLRVRQDGTAEISVGVHEMGQGIRTALIGTVAQKLGLSPDAVFAVIGDTRGAPQHTTAGSWGTATAIPPAELACDRLLAELNVEPGSQIFEALRGRGLTEYSVEVEHRGSGQPDAAMERLRNGLPAAIGPVYDRFVSLSYIAQFVEVKVEPTTRRIRVPRVVSVVDCGRVVNAVTAESQVRGGVIWGMSAALREGSEIDPRYGGFLNTDIAEYVIPVNADVSDIDVHMLNVPDTVVNVSGVKGLGEVVMTGMAGAISNAVYHATGRRLRDLPIRLEHLL